MEKMRTTTTKTTRPVEKAHFFKILLGDFARRLRLPPRFVGDHLRATSDRAVVVHDAEGGAWDVALEKSADGVFLSGGWAKFVEGHALQEHEFIVFRYDRDMHFTVVLAFTKVHARKIGFQEADSARKQSCLRKGRRKTIWRPQLMVVDVFLIRLACRRLQFPLVESLKIKHSGRHYWRRRRIKKEIMEDGASFPFRSTVPYFVAEMKHCEIVKPRVMRLPPEFSRAHTPAIRTWMNLHDSNGRVWAVKYIPAQGGGSSFSGGWTAFMRDNDLQIGDYCAFEMVAPAEFKVTVIRADEVPETYRRPKLNWVAQTPTNF